MANLPTKFITDRTRFFRSRVLDDQEERRISHIEDHGCSVLRIQSSTTGPSWSYTVGLYDTTGQAELITIGLLDETAHVLLNSAGKELRKGTNLAEGRHRELIGEVECEFRPVDPKWIRHLMGWAVWYNNGDDFPVLQAVYPDRENRFPEEEGFTEYFRQPLLQPDTPRTRIEEDFWASADPDSSLFNWRFPDPSHTMVFLSKTVHEGIEEITYVSHDLEDGAWQFLDDSMDDGGGAVLSCFQHPIDKDPTLTELSDLPLGWYAERATPSAPWVRHQHDPEEPEIE